MRRINRFLSILLIAALLLSLAGCFSHGDNTAGEPSVTTESTPATQPTTSTEPVENTTPSSPILYRATDDQGNTVYLFGSIHIGTKEMYPLPDYVMDAYHASDILAVEFDVVSAGKDLTAASQAMSTLVLTDGTTISDHISPELYQAAKEILDENHYYNAFMDMYKPIMWYSLIDSFSMMNADLDEIDGIDAHLLKLAHKEDKPIHDIESMESQYQMLSDMSMDLQTMLLESAVASYYNPLTPLQYLKMCHTWASGDEEALIAMISSEEESIPPEQMALYEEYNQAMSGNRNPLMAQYAREAMACGKTVFICVGAAHIVGPGALVEILTQDGYALERITEA